MAQTRIGRSSDSFCSYNQSAGPFYWIFEPGQYNSDYVSGEVGLNANGGGPGSYVRPDGVDIDSFLSGRDSILSRCNPPVPAIEDMAQPPLVMQNNDVSLLIAKDTRQKKSANDLSSVDYNRWQPALPANPQNLRNIIEDFAPQRGGMDTQNYAKLAWKPSVARGAAVDGNPLACTTILDPARACGEFCAVVNGYSPDIVARMPGKPQPDYPFEGITSQQIKAVGAGNCLPQMFYGPNYTDGGCGQPPKQYVLLDNDPMADISFSTVN